MKQIPNLNLNPEPNDKRLVRVDRVAHHISLAWAIPTRQRKGTTCACRAEADRSSTNKILVNKDNLVVVVPTVAVVVIVVAGGIH